MNRIARRTGANRPMRMAVVAVLGGTTALALSLAACAAAPATPSTEERPDAVVQTGVPEACAEAFPYAMAPANLADVEVLPKDWPEAPDGSTLCLTSSSITSGSTESLSYATTVDAEDALAYYESVLSDYRLAREPAPTGGELLVGDDEHVSFQIRATEGSIIIALVPTP